MSDAALAIARASYQRCQQNANVIPAFYEAFFKECPQARPMFAKTDLERQHKLLQHAIGLLFSYGQRPEPEPNLLTRVADRHGRNELKVDPSYHSLFVDSLLRTARAFDAGYTDETEHSWREAMAPGVAYMTSKS